MPVQFRYSYRLEIRYIASSNHKEYIIPSPSVTFVYIMHDYDNDIRPYIMVKIKLDASIYNMMINDQGKGKVSLNIMKYNKDGTSSVYTSYINDQFDFVMSENPNVTPVFDKEVAGQGIAYKTCMVGLFKSELMHYNQKQFDGVYKNTNTSSLIQNATSHMKILIEPFRYNPSIESIVVPPINSVVEFIAYINQKYNFYGDQYVYFNDFDKTYLKSNSGKYINANDGQNPYVAFDIRDMTNYKANTAGFIVDNSQNAYIIYTDPSYVQISTDRITPYTASNIVTIDSNGKQQMSKVDTSSIINTSPDKDSTLYIPSDDPHGAEYIANSLKNNTVTMVISKTEMDTSIFTPNKEYLISNYEGNNKYTGRYYMSFKQEYFYNTEVEFMCLSNIGLRMVVHY